ncbi:MAG: response regulator, partial [Planctomycetes bacterium]|nr:response regulator [Planctomycetota bacterium]
VLLSGSALIAFTHVENMPKEDPSSSVVAWLTLPVDTKELYRAIVENASGPGAGAGTQSEQETMEVLEQDLPSFNIATSDDFNRELPADTETDAISEPAELAEPATHEFATHRVLVVEDNLVNQKVAKGMLRKIGLEVDLANDGGQALEMSGKQDYALIFMDCQMPEMDGFEATRRIREREKETGTPAVPI